VGFLLCIIIIIVLLFRNLNYAQNAKVNGKNGTSIEIAHAKFIVLSTKTHTNREHVFTICQPKNNAFGHS